MLKIRVSFFDDSDPEKSECEFVETFCLRVFLDKEKTFEDKLEVIDEVLSLTKVELNENLLTWTEKIESATAEGTLSQVTTEMRSFFFEGNDNSDAHNSFEPLVYGPSNTPLHKTLISYPQRIRELSIEVQELIEKIQNMREQFVKNEMREVLQGASKATPIERIQWLGKTIDFYRLIDYLEGKNLIPPKNRARFARFFLDSKGTQMPEDSSPYTAKASMLPDTETKALINDIARNKSLG